MTGGPGDFRGELSADPDLRRQWGRASGPIALTPDLVAFPRDENDIASILCRARDAGRAVVPRGAGTGMPGGNVGAGICLDFTRHLTALGPVDAERRAVRVEAGVVASRVEEAARAAHLRFPPLPSSADRCTVGGMLANNSAGARSFGHGAVRNWVHSLDVVLGDGSCVTLQATTDRGGGAENPGRPEGGRPSGLPEALSSELSALVPSAAVLRDRWPRVRKNSSGYAWDRYLDSGNPLELVVGSEGTLGIVVAAELRLAPAADRVALVALGIPSRELLAPAVGLARERHAAACEFFGRRYLELSGLTTGGPDSLRLAGASALLLVELDREPEAGLEAFRDLADAHDCGFLSATDPESIRDIWALRHAASPIIKRESERRGRVSTQFIEDCVVPPDRLEDYLAGLDDILTRAGIDAVVFGHAGDANVHVNPLIEVDRLDWKGQVRSVLAEVVELVAHLGGTLAGEHGDGRLRAPYLERIWGTEWAEVFHRTKRAFDPAGILNPGVIVPLPGQDPLEGLTSERIA